MPAFSIHLLLAQTGAVSAAENVRKDQQKMYVLSEYYSILHQMVHIHYSAITRTLELTFSKPTQVSVTGK